MGCSSYCEFVVKLKNKKKILWTGEDGFSPIFFIPDRAKERLETVHSIEDLIKFVQVCIAADGMDEARAAEVYTRKCAQFDKQLRSIERFEDLEGLSFAWGQYFPEDGAPDEACTGQSLDYSFKTGLLKIKREATQDFIDEMFDVYGDMLDFDD